MIERVTRWCRRFFWAEPAPPEQRMRQLLIIDRIDLPSLGSGHHDAGELWRKIWNADIVICIEGDRVEIMKCRWEFPENFHIHAIFRPATIPEGR